MKEDEIDERSLVLRCQSGDKHAFGELVRFYMKRAYFTALGLVGSHDSALDLSQEAFVRAYRSIRKLDADRKFFTWYYQILRNLCFNFIRNSARHAKSFSEIGDYQLQHLVDDTPNAAVIAESNEKKEIVWKAMNRLKPMDREIIILKDFQELSYKEIGEVLSCPAGTVMSRLYHARQALKSKLERYFDE